MRVLTVTLMLLVIGLAGCAGDEPVADDQPINDTEDTDDTPVVNETADPVDDTPVEETNETVENLVPVVNFTADVVNGTAPLLVTFTISVDDDSEGLMWTFAINGNETLNGTGAMASFNHTFDAGVWNLTVAVNDGGHEVLEMLVIMASLPASAPEPVVITGHVTYNAHVAGTCESEASDVPAEVVGWAYKVDTSSYEATWFNAAGDDLGTGASGIVPDGAATVTACYGGDFSIGILPPATGGADWSITARAMDG